MKIPFALYKTIYKTYRRIPSLVPPFSLGILLSIPSIVPILTPVLSSTATESNLSNDLKKSIHNRAEYSFLEPSSGDFHKSATNEITIYSSDPLIDPSGQILGCGGQKLPNYTGFQVGLYEPDPKDPTGTELGRLVALTPTERPDIQGNNIPLGLEPNTQNINPYPLTDETEGRYSFLLDRTAGQLVIGKTYILVVDPPANQSFYTQRRIKLQILTMTRTTSREIVTYRATSLDGMPIAAANATSIDQEAVLIPDADRVGLQLLAVQFTGLLCNPAQVQIAKSGDRAQATVGDIILYRLTVRNSSDAALDNLTITDTLPLGFRYVADSAKASVGQTRVALTVAQQERNLVFRTPITLPREAVLTLVYAAQLTPDALRGNGQNIASVNGLRVDNDMEVNDGPATHRVRISSGLVSDCGTLVGRVFVDQNFDGEQQDGEKGVPNAALYLDDGNRVTTDENGLFSQACVLPGYRNASLDLTSLPGYTLAPNERFIERNSPGRLVHLAPGGMARMNFAVMPLTPAPEGTSNGAKPQGESSGRPTLEVKP